MLSYGMEKKLTLRDAQEQDKLGQFIEENPSEGDMEQFEEIMESIVEKK